MSDTVIIPLGPLGTLELPRELFEAHLRTAPTPAAAAPANTPSLVDVKAAAAHFGVPASWLAEAARSGKVPSTMIGRYRRFNLGKLAAVIGSGSQPEGHAQLAESKGKKPGCYRGATALRASGEARS